MNQVSNGLGAGQGKGKKKVHPIWNLWVGQLRADPCPTRVIPLELNWINVFATKLSTDYCNQKLSFASLTFFNSAAFVALINRLLSRSTPSVVGIVLNPSSRTLRTSVSRSSMFLELGA
jgi:hypothetical protein